MCSAYAPVYYYYPLAPGEPRLGCHTSTAPLPSPNTSARGRGIVNESTVGWAQWARQPRHGVGARHSYTRVPTRYSTVGAVQAARPRDADRRDA